MGWQPVSIGGGCFADDTKPWSSQDTCNRIPVSAEVPGGRSPTLFRSAPGLQSFANTGTGPVRGMHDAEGKLMVVSGTSLYRITPTGVATFIGSVSGTGRVVMAHNQITGGNEVIIVTGGTVSYVYNTVTGVLDTVPSTAYPGSICVDYLNGYLLQVEPQRRYFFHSELYDAHKYLSTSTYESEASPDLIQGLIVDHLELIVLNERTIELFQNTGAQSAIFESKRIVIEQGCAGPYAYAKIDNSVVFLGNDGIVYRLNGYQPQRISTTPIEQALSRNDITKAIAFTYADRGHKIFYLTLPDGQTWGYDVATQLWHRRESYSLKRWRLDHLLYWNGKWIGGDFQNGMLYILDWDYPQEGTQPLIRQRTFGVEHASGDRITIDAVQIEYDTGSPQASSTFNAASPPVPVPPLGGTLAIQGTPPSGQVTIPYTYTFIATGGSGGGYVWAIASGSLPTGVTLNTGTGVISGTPTTIATSAFVLRVTDSGANTTTANESIAISAGDIATTILADSPILYWKLDETSGTTAIDYSGFGRNGTIAGTYTQATSGLTLTAADTSVIFPGNVNGSPTDVGTTRTWSQEVIFTRTAGPVVSGLEWLAGQFRSPNFGYYPNALTLNGTTYLVISQGNPTGSYIESGGGGGRGATGPTAIASATRTILTIVREPFDGTNDYMRLYVQGVLVTSTLVPISSVADPSNGAGFVVGGGQAVNGYYPASYGFLGKVEHVSVYNQALTAARVLLHAKAAGLA